MVDGIRGAVLRLLVPPRCSFCHAQTTGAKACDGCRDALPWNRSACPVCARPQAAGVSVVCARCAAKAPHYDAAWAAFRHQAPIAQAVYGLKYHADFRQAHLLGAAMAEVLSQRAGPLPELLLPVPLHAGRLRRRGYNQAVELARALAGRLAIAVDISSASRRRATPDQIGQRAAERRRNVSGAFAVGAGVAGKHLAIVDDVMTTGSTVNELARVCREAGALRIEVWIAARAV